MTRDSRGIVADDALEQAPRHAMLLHPDDDVGVALRDLPAGASVTVRRGAHDVCVVLRESIPLGHKFALHPVASGAHVRKFGQIIGAATSSIEPGAHVHIHNLASLRACARP
jgi:altronate dehydratase